MKKVEQAVTNNYLWLVETLSSSLQFVSWTHMYVRVDLFIHTITGEAMHLIKSYFTTYFTIRVLVTRHSSSVTNMHLIILLLFGISNKCIQPP